MSSSMLCMRSRAGVAGVLVKFPGQEGLLEGYVGTPDLMT